MNFKKKDIFIINFGFILLLLFITILLVKLKEIVNEQFCLYKHCSPKLQLFLQREKKRKRGRERNSERKRKKKEIEDGRKEKEKEKWIEKIGEIRRKSDKERRSMKVKKEKMEEKE